MKNIYELMNEIKTDTEEYPQEEFSEFEAKKWNKKLSKELKRPRRKKYASIAACAVICMALLAAPASSYSWKRTEKPHFFSVCAANACRASTAALFFDPLS